MKRALRIAFIGSGIGCAGTPAAPGESPTAILTVIRDGPGFGSIQSASGPEEDGIDCGVHCSRAFSKGTSVSLRASAREGSRFDGWIGGCVGLLDCTVDLADDTVVRAHFSLAPGPIRTGQRLTVAPPVGGTIYSEPPGIYCGTQCNALFPDGGKVNLAAVPSRGSEFRGWSGDCEDAGRCEITMNGPKHVAAAFGFELVVRRELLARSPGAPIAEGEVVSRPEGIRCGATCRGVFAPDEVVTLRAEPGVGSRFLGWTGVCEEDAGRCRVTMAAPRVVTASFRSLGVIWLREFLGAFRPHGLAVDGDGASIVGGSFVGAIELDDAGTRSPRSAGLLAKFTENGELSWARSFVSDAGVAVRPCHVAAACEGVSTVAVDSNRNIYVALPFSGELSIAGIPGARFVSDGGTDIVFGKFTPAGAPVWMKAIGGPSNDWPEGIAIGSAGKIALTGVVSPSILRQNTFLAEFSDDGTWLWEHWFAPRDWFLVRTVTRGVSIGRRGEVSVAGSMQGEISFYDDGGVRLFGIHGFVARYRETGAFGWGVVWPSWLSSFASTIASDPDGDLVVTGTALGSVDVGGKMFVNPSQANRLSLLAKYSGDGGSLVWARTMGNFGQSVVYPGAHAGPSVVIDDDGEIVVAGLVQGATSLGGDLIPADEAWPYLPTLYAAKYGPRGEHHWSIRLGAVVQNSLTVPVRLAVGRDRSIVISTQVRAFDWSPAARRADGRTRFQLIKLAP
ncbi:MAG: hypothetical protein HYY84_17580 [Deltaproteobacteria bacterium]|nr:hypothetical protein [Deltaproteobacteria bacterium]